jgi:hypothetical protein
MLAINCSTEIIYRKASMKHNTRPKGYELILSYDTQQATTRGFLKGAESAQIQTYIMHLKASGADIIHPLLLPMILLVDKVGNRSEEAQREARNQIRSIETRLKQQMGHRSSESLHKGDGLDLSAINADLTVCHSLVWKHPRTYIELIDNFQAALNAIYKKKIEDLVGANSCNVAFERVHKGFNSRLDLSRQRLQGMESASITTLSRIDMQRTALHNILLIRQSQTALQIEDRQQIEAQQKFTANESWSRTQLSLSLLGTFFLPGAFIAVIFYGTFNSYSFADVRPCNRQSSALPSSISKQPLA